MHIPNYITEPETVTRYINYKPPTATKTIRQQPQLDIIRVPDTEYTPLPSLQIPSDTDSSTRSKLYSPLIPFVNSLLLYLTFSNLLHKNLIIYHLENRRVLFWFLNIDINLDLFLHADLALLIQLCISHLYQVILLLDLLDNTPDLFQQTQLQHTHPTLFHTFFTSGIDTASLLSPDVQTAYMSGNFL